MPDTSMSDALAAANCYHNNHPTKYILTLAATFITKAIVPMSTTVSSLSGAREAIVVRMLTMMAQTMR